MVTISANLQDSLGQPLEGLIRVTLQKPVSTPAKDAELLTVPATVSLVSGAATFDLEATTDDGVSYLFEVVDSNDQIVRAFTAQVPNSGDVVQLATLSEQSGITPESYDGNLTAVVRRLYVDPVFWDRARDTLAPYKGEYDADTFYKRGDTVLYQGSSWVYVAAIATAGSTPSELPTSFWRLWSRKGEPGAGTQGALDPYDVNAWTDNTEAVAKGAMVDVIEGLVTQAEVDVKANSVDALLTNPRRTDTLQKNANSSQLVPASWVRARINEIANSLNPIGSVMHWMFPVAPVGWLHIDGDLFEDAKYPELAALYGHRHNNGGDPSDWTRLPDWRGVGVIGSDFSPNTGDANRLIMQNAKTLGEIAGNNFHTLKTSELPVIDIGLKRGTGTGSKFGIDSQVMDNRFGDTNDSYEASVNIGSGDAHSIVHASGVGYWIQYAGLPAT